MLLHAQPDYSIILALLGVLVSIGIPALDRGEWILGGVCIGLAIIVEVWWGITMKKTALVNHSNTRRNTPGHSPTQRITAIKLNKYF